MEHNNTHEVFLEILRGGIWEKEVRLKSYKSIDYNAIYSIAEEQSIIGLITAGLEQVKDVKIPQEWSLQFVGSTLQLEQRNKDMNRFVEDLILRMRKADIYTLLVKGQSVAQCYERPLWRACGDVDLFLSDDNYERAKGFLTPFASKIEPEANFKKHLGLYINGWLVELHGSLRNGLSAKIDKALDNIQKNTFYGGIVRSCVIGNTQVFLLGIENDIIYVFSHILDHFYKGGIGLRQICDWMRVIWKNMEKLNLRELEKMVRQMGLMSEWKAFGAFTVDYLGMPEDAMPFYSPDRKWKLKAERICTFILEVGNFGHNRDNSYYNKPFVVRKAISFGRRCGDLMRHARIFPMDSLRFLPGIVFNGMKAALK